MNSNIEIVYDKYLYTHYDAKIKKIINTFKNKQMILNTNLKNKVRDDICINIELIKLLDNNYCENCTKYADYYGYCIDHYNQQKINTVRENYIKDIKCEKNKNYYITGLDFNRQMLSGSRKAIAGG